MKSHVRRTVDPAGQAGPPVKNWQQRYGAVLVMAVFGLLLLATVFFEALKK